MVVGFLSTPGPVPFALVYAINFYVSCERVIDYRLRDWQVVKGLIGMVTKLVAAVSMTR